MNTTHVPILLGGITAMALIPKGLVVAHGAGLLSIFNTTTWKCQKRLVADDGDNQSHDCICGLSDDSDRFATGNANGQLMIWSEAGADVEPLHVEDFAYRNGNLSAVCSVGDFVVTGAVQGEIKLWDATNNFNFLDELTYGDDYSDDPNGEILVALRDGYMLAVGLDDYTVWDTRNWLCLQRLYYVAAAGTFRAAAALSNGGFAMAGDHTIFVWTQSQGRLRRIFQRGVDLKIPGADYVWSMCELLDGKLLTVGGSGRVRIFDIEDRDCIADFQIDVPEVNVNNVTLRSLVALPDGRVVIGADTMSYLVVLDNISASYGEKRPRTESAAATVPTVSLTPNKDKYFNDLRAYLDTAGAIGYTLIQGIESDDDEEEDEEEVDEEDEAAGGNKIDCTPEQLSTLRMFLITANRQKCLQRAMSFVDPMDGMWTTHTGNVVISGIPKEVQRALRCKTKPEKFDALFTLTYALHRYDMWLHDNEMYGRGGPLEQAIKLLGKTWKNLLSKNSNEQLGIDERYSRPALESLLEQFQDLVDESESCGSVHFTWK